MNDISAQIKLQLPNIIKHGAFVFDIDNTLVKPDDSFENYPELMACLQKIFAKKIRVAFISGSPGAVIQNRLLPALEKLNLEMDVFKIYANGGSSKLSAREGRLIADKNYQATHRIPISCLEQAQASLTQRLVSGFDLDAFVYEKVKEVWFRRRVEQWGSLSIEFDDRWIRGEDWKIDFLDDLKMAEVKAGKGQAKTTYPFINVRGVERDEAGKLLSCSSFSPTGFYILSEGDRDGLDLDLRDEIIGRLKKDLTEWGDQLNFYKAGRSTIDITHKNVSKASAIEDFISSAQLEAKNVYYFGDEFFDGGNDAVFMQDDFLKKNPIKLVAVNAEEPSFKQLNWIGAGPDATLLFLKKIFE